MFQPGMLHPRMFHQGMFHHSNIPVHVYSRGVNFLIFWIFNFYQLNLDWQKNSKTKVEEVFFFIFMSSYSEMSFYG
jgi:hypothetical protein